MIVSSGQTSGISSAVNGGTVEGGGSLIVSAGGTAANFAIDSAGSATVLAGGSALFTTLSGGAEVVQSGGTDSGANITFGGTLTVSSGGTAFDPQFGVNIGNIGQAGTLEVLGGGTVVNVNSGFFGVAAYNTDTVTIASGGVFSVTASGAAGFATLDAGAIVTLGAGATLRRAIVSSGASLTIGSGQSGSYDQMSGGSEIVSGGYDSASTVGSSGQMTVLAGGTATGFAVLSGGILTVSSGGVTSSGTVVGTETVLAGGSAVAGGGSPFGGQAVVSSGGVAIDTQGATVISAGGTEAVQSGSSGDGVTLEHGAILSAVAGATLIDFTVVSTTLSLFAGISAALAKVSSGGVLLASGGLVVNDSTIFAGGSADAMAGAILSYTTVSGGTLTLQAGASATRTTISGGTLSVLSGGVAIDPNVYTFFGGSGVVSSGGTLEVLSGHGADGMTLLSGAVLIAPSGGGLAGMRVGSGATLAVSSGVAENQSVILDGGYEAVGSGVLVSGITVMRGGTEAVLSGGIANGTMLGGDYNPLTGAPVSSLQPGGVQLVSSGGIANGTTIYQGGVETVLAGGLGSGAHVSSGGSVLVSSGGQLIGSIVSAGGGLVIGAGGTASGVSLGQPGASVPSEFGISGGSAAILSGGTISGLALFSGGTADVAGGGTVIDALIGGATLDLAAGAVAQGSITFGPGIAGSDLIIGGTVMPGVPIDFLGPSDTIDLASVPFGAGGSVALGSGGVLSVVENGHTYDFTLVSAGIAGHKLSLVSDGNGGTAIEVACFAAGTRIATPHGAVAAEALRAGDAVLALQDGAWRAARVRWVGRMAVDLIRHARPWHAAPIRIRAGAIAEGVPARDLWLSPDHAIFLDGVLIQAQALVNGATVVQEFPARIDYVHVELDRHAVLCAEGLAAESYLDTGNRAMFAGEPGVRPLHVDLAHATAWAERACAPLLLGGARVAAAHARVLERAQALGAVLTTAPALSVTREGAVVRLRSRSFVPAWLGGSTDRRRLGVAVTSLRLGGRRLPRTAFGEGWHAPEPGLRWTDGDAVLHLPRDRPLTLQLVAAGARYWLDGAAAAASRVA